MRKVYQKLLSPKFWLTIILPIILLTVWISLVIFISIQHINNLTLVIFAQSCFIVAVLIMSGYEIYEQFKYRHIIRGVAVIISLVCFLGLQIAHLVMIPKFYNAVQEENELYQIYKDTPFDDTDYNQLWDLWREAVHEVTDLKFTIGFINWGSYVAIFLGGLCWNKQKSNAIDNVKEEN